MSYHLPVLGANTTAVQMVAPVRKILDPPTYALPHFILFTDNCRPTQYMHCHISLYLQTTADQLKQQIKLYRYSLIFCITTANLWRYFYMHITVRIFITCSQFFLCLGFIFMTDDCMSFSRSDYIPFHNVYTVYSLQVQPNLIL